MDLTASPSPPPAAGHLSFGEAVDCRAALDAIEARVHEAGPPLTWAYLRADLRTKGLALGMAAVVSAVVAITLRFGWTDHPERAIAVLWACAGTLVVLLPLSWTWTALRRWSEGPNAARAELFKDLAGYATGHRFKQVSPAAPPLDRAAWAELSEAVRQHGDRFDTAPFLRWLAAERRKLADLSRPPSPNVDVARRAFLATRIGR